MTLYSSQSTTIAGPLIRAGLVVAMVVLWSQSARGQEEIPSEEIPFEEIPPPEGEAADEADEPLKVAVFIFPELEMDTSVATEIIAGMRRGIRGDPRLQYIDASKALQSASEDGEETNGARGAKLLERALESSVDGRWRQVVTQLDDATDLFESDLAHTRRGDLVDATMLWGAAQCQLHRQRVCESAFRRVVTFRENVEYNLEFLPPDPAAVFEEVRDDTLVGPRGSLHVETEPPGAEVFVDGRFVGAAPTRAEGLLAGDHYVTLKMVGYERQVQRVTVQTDFEETVSYGLLQIGDAQLLYEALEAARAELGQPRVGEGMRSLWSNIFADQVIFGELRRAGEGEIFELTLYLYDFRTNHQLRRFEQRLNWEERDLTITEELIAEIYEGVDLSGHILPAPDELPTQTVEHQPFYRRWWFWSIIGVVVVGTTVGVASAIEIKPAGQIIIDLP